MAQAGQNSGMHAGIARMLVRMSSLASSSRTRASAAAVEAGHPRLGVVLAHIQQHLGEPLPLRQLAGLIGLSVGRFVTVFRLTVGMTPHRYISMKRVRYAQWLLRQGHSPALTAHACGFYDQSHLSRCLKSACGMTPREYQDTDQPVAGRAEPSPFLPVESFHEPQRL